MGWFRVTLDAIIIEFTLLEDKLRKHAQSKEAEADTHFEKQSFHQDMGNKAAIEAARAHGIADKINNLVA